ncbi:MAG: septum formation initiator family protein [Pseudomonadota bacterium]
MRKLIQKRGILKQNMLMIIGLCLSFYFSFHLLAGERGYFRLMSLNHQMEQSTGEYALLSDQRAKLERKIVMMRPGSVDRDLLEERVRLVLGYRDSNEVILLQNSL